MANLNLFTFAVATTFTHFIFITARPQINMFYSVVLLRGCASILRSNGTNSAFAALYNQAVMSESLIIDLYFMIQTKTLHSAGWLMGVGIGLYLLAKLIIDTRKEEDAFTTLLYFAVHAAFTVAHAIIMTEF